ncbi:cell division protein FtsQ [Bacillus coahuilensis m2-6]|uniref:Cell division protein DivIB n=1 Tax=Bacillus coahuilensis p1.1.43 TaxID=1150625 RepID=A0A147K9D1_9BACI|nr:FtsQ-type POTRA domain-containing protein [Bacillus coahuilensis]KUP07020.1 cell division protein FtsQ [Bacillus coahuilensis p1.1.43]KUP08576.1 cell division protein FtsQ [Bacillus coahuilensis m2-6]
MVREKVVSLEDRVPKLKEQRKKKANRRLVMLLSLFFILIVFVVYIQSPLSQVQDLVIEGNELLTAETIVNETEIEIGTTIWSIRKSSVEEKIKEHPVIKDVRIQLLFPNKYLIQVTEYKQSALLVNGTEWFPVLENGYIVNEPTTDWSLQSYPIVRGFIEDKYLESLLTQLTSLDEQIVQRISEIQYTPKETDAYHITLYMNDGFEVSATIRTLAEKLTFYPSIISQLDPNQKGVIDLEVGTYFKAYETPKQEGEETTNEDN